MEVEEHGFGSWFLKCKLSGKPLTFAETKKSERMTTVAPALAFSEYEIERNKPMPSLNHSIVQTALASELRVRFRKQFTVASELTLELSNWESVPDLAVFPKMKFDSQNDIITMTEPPLCAIEIISPSQSLTDLKIKANNYFQHGVKSCWIVVPVLENIYVFSSPSDYEIYRATQTLRDDVLDISMPLTDIFEG